MHKITGFLGKMNSKKIHTGLEQVIESTASILQNWASYGWLLDSLTQKIHFRVTMFSFGITSKSAKISAQAL